MEECGFFVAVLEFVLAVCYNNHMSELRDMEVVGEVQASTHWTQGSRWSDMLQQLHGNLFDQAEKMGADALLLQGARINEGDDVVAMSVSGIALRGTSAEAFALVDAEAPGSLVPLPRA